jgi:hypothetical protein
MKWCYGKEARTNFDSLKYTREGSVSQALFSVEKGIQKSSEAQQRDVTTN